MNEEIIGVEVSGEIYPIKDEGTSGKTQTLETKVSIIEANITNLETALTEQGRKLAQIEANIGETDIQELKSLVDTHEEEIKELTELIKAGEVYTTRETVCGTWIDGKPIYRIYARFPQVELIPDGWATINSLSIAGIHEVINARAKRSADNAIIPVAVRARTNYPIEVDGFAAFGIESLILEYTKR